MTDPQPKRYIYVADRAARAYDSPYVGKSCVRAGPWIRGKAIMRFDDGREVVCLVGNGRMRIERWPNSFRRAVTYRRSVPKRRDRLTCGARRGRPILRRSHVNAVYLLSSPTAE